MSLSWITRTTTVNPDVRGTVATIDEFTELIDSRGIVIGSFKRASDGAVTFSLNNVTIADSDTPQTASSSEINQFNDVSAYQESITAAGALSVTKVYSGLAVSGGGAVTLASPSATMLGQIKTIEMTADTGDVTLALTNIIGQSSGTTATFNDVRDALILLALSDKWLVIKELGISLL